MYSGAKFPIEFGSRGLFTDAPSSKVPVGALTRAYNCTYSNDCIETEPGSIAFNSTPFPSGVRYFFDFWPDSVTQRIVAILNDGRIWRATDQINSSLVAKDPTVPLNLAPDNLTLSPYVSMIEGGAEDQGRVKKLFIYSGYSPVQVISGNSALRHNIQRPPADWSGTYQPIGGIIHRNLHMAWGNQNSPHSVYVSSGTDHEDFLTTPIIYQCYPGDSETIVDAIDFRGVLYLIKYPFGVYTLVDTDPDPANWYFQKLTGEFGGSCPHCMVSTTDDVLVANSIGSVTSLKAALIFGDVTTADVMHQIGIRNSTVVETNPGGHYRRNMIYYPFKKIAKVSFQSADSQTPNRILNLDYKRLNQPPLAAWSTKDRPNSLGLVKDVNKVSRPAYGDDSGFVYLMDSANPWVGTTPDGVNELTNIVRDYYIDVMTGYTDLSAMDQSLQTQVANLNKNFERIEIEFIPTGNWDLNLDWFIDGRLRGTRNFSLKSGTSDLDSLILGSSTVESDCTLTTSVPISGTGKRLALRLYSDVRQIIKIVSAKVYFKPGDEQNMIAGA